MLAIAAFPQTAFAGTVNADKGKSDSAPGQVKKSAASESASSQPSAGTPTAADHPEDYSTHDQTNGPGGQVCDGDPDNAPGAGGNYENTCPDGPSQNGAGDGNATGKPCAGCVGNADDKNPQGQATSGPSDHNNGYECDQKGRSANEGNNGVGYGNPAHTGCQDTPPPPEKCPDGSPMPANGSCTPPPCVPATGNVCGQETPSCVASASENRCGGGTSVLGETLGRPVEVLGVQLTAAPAAAVAPAALATTGAEVLGFARFGALLALLGLALTVIARRRRATVTAE